MSRYLLSLVLLSGATSIIAMEESKGDSAFASEVDRIADKIIQDPLGVLKSLGSLRAAGIDRLRECADESCIASRCNGDFRYKYECAVINQLLQLKDKKEIVHYVSFGSGYLFQDLVILTKLIKRYNVKNIKISLIDSVYTSHLAKTALKQFRTYLDNLAGCHIEVKSYSCVRTYIDKCSEDETYKADILVAADISAENICGFGNALDDCFGLLHEALNVGGRSVLFYLKLIWEYDHQLIRGTLFNGQNLCYKHPAEGIDLGILFVYLKYKQAIDHRGYKRICGEDDFSTMYHTSNFSGWLKLLKDIDDDGKSDVSIEDSITGEE